MNGVVVTPTDTPTVSTSAASVCMQNLGCGNVVYDPANYANTIVLVVGLSAIFIVLLFIFLKKNVVS